MRTSKDDIREWFKSGVRQEATHLVVICDTFDYTDYPVYILPGQDARKKVFDRDGKNMEKIMEVFDLSKDVEEQITGDRYVRNY